jgi:MFS family permease
MIAFPWLVLDLTGSPSAAGALGAITALPLLVAFLFAGTVVDRVGRRRVAVVADLLSMLSVALVPLLGSVVDLSFAAVAAIAVLGATFDPAGISAREAMLPEAARAAGLRLERANGIHEAVWGGAYLMGPGLAGLSIGAFGAQTTFLIAAAMFAGGATTMAAVRMPGAGRPRPTGVGILAGTAEGIRFVWDDRVLRAVALLSMMLVGFWLPIEGVILPVHFQGQAQPERLGATLMALSAGGIAGALLYSAAGHRVSRRLALAWTLTATGVALIGMAVLPPFGLLLVLAGLAGFVSGPIGPLVNLMIQHRAPSALRGRVVGLMTSAAYVAGPIGYLVAGPAVEFAGLQETFLAMAVGFTAVGVWSWFMPSLHRMDDTAGPPGEEEGGQHTGQRPGEVGQP